MRVCTCAREEGSPIKAGVFHQRPPCFEQLFPASSGTWGALCFPSRTVGRWRCCTISIERERKISAQKKKCRRPHFAVFYYICEIEVRPASARPLSRKDALTMTIFSKIAAGEIPSYKCAENEDFYAFLDINPVAKGHTLVIPRREVDYIFDLDDETLAAYHRFAKRVALAIGEAFPYRKVGMAVLGLEVPHAHIHLIPLNNEGDMDFRKPKLQLPAEEMQAAADAIRAAFERQNPA